MKLTKKIKDKIKDVIANMSNEEWDKYFPKDTKPKGWISIEEHLPMMNAIDIINGGTKYKVCYKDGTEDYSIVSDHNTWYYYAKEEGITHWLNN